MRPPLSADDDAVVDALATRKPSETLPILLEVARRQGARRRPSDLLAQRERDAFVAPSPIDQRLATRFDAAALDAAPEFEALLLSPLAPLGSCAVVSPTAQDRSVATARSTEVVSDPTNVLAIECARRLLAGKSHVRFCTIHQVVRPQRFEAKPGFTKHFRLFALAEAGAALADQAFEVEAVAAHAAVFLRVLDGCEALGCGFPNRRARLLVGSHAHALGDRIYEALRERLDVPVELVPFSSGYYDGIRLLLGADSAAGPWMEIADIGVFDWMAKLTSNRRMRFVAGGLGLQLLALRFRRE